MGDGLKPPRAALAEDRRCERRGKGVLEASGGDQGDDCRSKCRELKGLSRHRCGQVSAFWPWDRVAWEARQTLTTLEATRPDRGCARATEPRSIGSWSDAISLVAALFRSLNEAAARLE